MDGLGTQAREVARAEPAAPRRDGHFLPAARVRHAGGARGSPLRDHARRRFPAPEGGRAPAGRHDRPPAEHPAIRPDRRPRRRGARDPSASGHPDAARDGIRDLLPARLLGAPRHRSLRLRRVRRLPGPLRRGDLHGQGHLRRGCVRGSSRRPGAGERAAIARPLRGPLRARRVRVGRRALRRLPGSLRSRGVAPAPLGPGRLAAPAVDPRDRQEPSTGLERPAGSP